MLKATQIYPNVPSVSGQLTSVNEPDIVKGFASKDGPEPEEKKSLKKEILEMVRDCGDRSSIHSLPSFASKNVPFLVKVVWMICVVISWGYFGYQIYGVVNLYLTYSVVSAVSIGYEAPTDFPSKNFLGLLSWSIAKFLPLLVFSFLAVDICNLNPFNGYETGDYFADVISQNELTVDGSDTVRAYTDEVSSKFKSFFQYMRLTNQLAKPGYEYGFLLKDILISCEYQGVNCSASDFYWYYDYNYGNCYRFNGLDLSQTVPSPGYNAKSVRQSSKAGWRNGLMLEIYAG